ncbi:MAG: hypothetical protein NTZ78_13640 [Candidatus Aureabacteria bacterium]|nr:hypothetical protein [Candidatus Auribacterota bacterium]
MKRYIVALVVFSLSLTYFVLAHRAYLPSQLVIDGSFDNEGELFLSWDSGQGFHPVERVSIRVIEERTCSKAHLLEIRRAGGGNDGTIVIKGLELNSLLFNLFDMQRTGPVRVEQDGSLSLTAPESAVSCRAVFTAVGIEFAAGRQFGTARVSIDGTERTSVDLSAPGDTTKNVVVRCSEDYAKNRKVIPLPPVKIRALRLDSDREFHLNSARILSARGEAVVPVVNAVTSKQAPPSHAVSVVFRDVHPGTELVRPRLIGIQFLLSLCLACAGYGLMRFWNRARREGGGCALRYIFVQRMHWIFWSMFAFSSGVLVLWLLGQWPGWVTWDSFVCWTESVTLDFSNYHPYLYCLYLLAIRQLWDSPAAVALVQIGMTAALGSYIFYFCISRGPRWVAIVVIPFFLACVFSIPVGIYTISIWKDIPFALLILFWAFFLFYSSIQKRAGHLLRYAPMSVVWLSLLLVLLCMVRHNGIINIVVIPFLLIIAGLMPWRTFLRFALLSCALFFLLFYLVPHSIHISNRYNPRIQVYASITSPLASIFSGKWYYSDDYKGDREIIERWMSLEEIRNRYDPAHDLFSGYIEEKFQRLPDQDKDRIIALFRSRLLPNLPQFMAARVHMFFVAFGLGESLCLNGNELKDIPVGGLWGNPKSPFVCFFSYAPKSAALNLFQESLLRETTMYKGLRGGIFVYWNLFFPLLLMLAAFWLYRWIPATALFAFFILCQVGFLFLILNESEFRYFYFLYLAGFFVLPLALCEVRLRSRTPRVQ